MPKHAAKNTADATLERAARRAGVLTVHADGLGRTTRPPREVVQSLCDAIESGPVGDGGAVAVVIAGARSAAFTDGTHLKPGTAGSLHLQDGGTITATVASACATDSTHVTFGGPVPLGVHELALDGSPHRAFVLARPRSLNHIVRRAGRRLALFLPLYAVSPGGPSGTATYTDLRKLCDWADQTAGALVGTLPLFPAFLDRPFEPSPYAPVSRLFWNELFIDPRSAPEWRSTTVRNAAGGASFKRDAARAAASPDVDYRRSWRAARLALKAMAAHARRSPRRWAQITAASSATALAYAQFRAAVDATGKTWDKWPSTWPAGRVNLAAIDPADVDLYFYAQALAAAQLAPLGGATNPRRPLYLDLPVGVHAHGFDTFTRPDLFLHGFSAGAPADALAVQGQTWGFPPLHPRAGRADGYAHLRAVLRHMLSVAGVLRIDHVMGLYRMFCVPSGRPGTDGAYIRYPEHEMFAIVMIEAARAGAVVVGEDLGTVPPAVRQAMKESGILGMHVQQYALGGPPGNEIHPASPHVLASLNTHDAPTFASYWHADDVALRLRLKHTTKSPAAAETAGRAACNRTVASALRALKLPTGTAQATALSLMRLQARGPAPLTQVNLEDLWAERRPQNVPGTSTEYPNWRRRAAKKLPALLKDPKAAAALALLQRERNATTGKARP